MQHYNVGDEVFYKYAKNPHWQGPAKIIGLDNKVVFLRQGRFTLATSQTRVIKSSLIKDEVVTKPQQQKRPAYQKPKKPNNCQNYDDSSSSDENQDLNQDSVHSDPPSSPEEEDTHPEQVQLDENHQVEDQGHQIENENQ